MVFAIRLLSRVGKATLSYFYPSLRGVQPVIIALQGGVSPFPAQPEDAAAAQAHAGPAHLQIITVRLCKT